MTDHYMWTEDGLQYWKGFRKVLQLQPLTLVFYCCQIKGFEKGQGSGRHE